jgi:hypothetical protein
VVSAGLGAEGDWGRVWETTVECDVVSSRSHLEGEERRTLDLVVIAVGGGSSCLSFLRGAIALNWLDSWRGG